MTAIPILQCALAAGCAWWVATVPIGHQKPFFAPIAAVVSLGVALGARFRRSVELVVGVAVGVGIGDVLINMIGSGAWQIVLVVALAMIAAVLLDGGPVITVQAASSAVLVATLLPPGANGGFDRMIDALTGGLVGVAVVAMVPTNPILRAKDTAGEILGVAAEVLRMCADGLMEQNAKTIAESLHLARDTQAKIDALRNDLRGGHEISRISPLHWNTRAKVARLAEIADPLDNAVRNIRVLVRRSLSLVRDDEILDPRLVDEVEKLSHAVETVRSATLAGLEDRPGLAEAQRELRAVAAGARFDLVRKAGLSASVVLAQLRSTIVDLLQVTGVDRKAALATLPPTVPNPFVPPEPDITW
ncbi:FUSC family protein [Antrihabitans stalactiti]|uniref:FUSC family protein n=1 Tax=Antrihabitans stalactiti TaxID=2584121 RepID=UPI0019805524|nr:FUSC family protein [Antrihabitans stalactiti]